jgi:predicted Zn-dependent protease
MFTSSVKVAIKILTIGISVLFAQPLFSAVVSLDPTSSYLRIEIASEKNHLVIDKKGSTVFLRTLNSALFTQVAEELANLKLPQKYFKGLRSIPPGENDNISTIAFELIDPTVEVFSFYKDREKNHVLDFWRENDEVAESSAAIAKVETIEPIPQKLPPVIKRPALKAQKNSKREMASVESTIPVVAAPVVQTMRDFRYGASLTWDYAPLVPSFKGAVDVARKTPEFFYPVKDREFQKDEKESHLQLAINLYRKRDWGLMNKTITLFQTKYGTEDNWELIEYLKANAILRENLESGKTEPTKMAIAMFSNMAEKSQTYDLKKALTKYLLSYYIETSQPIEALKIAKRYYVITKENFDYEESAAGAEAILFGLANLSQLDDIRALLKEKTIAKIIPKQLALAYEMFVLMKLGQSDAVIKLYEGAKSSLSKPVHEAILFNVGEAYFRMANYPAAVAIFDDFASSYSFHAKAQEARLRIALAFEISEKDTGETLALYKNAIDRISDRNLAFEAMLRYVAMRSVRKINPDDSDREVRVFLELDAPKKNGLTRELKKLLWLVRLRTFINDGKFTEAMSYLSAIPLESLPPVEKRVFEADGAEIVYGLISEHYEAGDYTRVVKVWESYRKKYIEKVANDPYINFVVGRAYLKLGFYDAFDKAMSSFTALAETPSKTFPVWAKREQQGNRSRYLVELNLVRNLALKNWDAASRGVDELIKVAPEDSMAHYYRGIIAYYTKRPTDAAKSLETYLANKGSGTHLDPSEVAEMLMAYTDSLYEIRELDKYAKVAKAVLEDTKSYRPEDPYMARVRERIGYLDIEILAGKKNAEGYMRLEPAIDRFKKDFSKSDYMGRVDYLLGVALINNQKTEEGKTLFQGMLKNDKVSGYLKELIKSELALLTIKERTL